MAGVAIRFAVIVIFFEQLCPLFLRTKPFDSFDEETQFDEGNCRLLIATFSRIHETEKYIN